MFTGPVYLTCLQPPDKYFTCSLAPAYLACLLSHGHLTVTVLHEKLSISLIKTALRYSAPEYCAQLWSRFAHTSRVDVQLNSTMRLISGTLRSTPLP